MYQFNLVILAVLNCLAPLINALPADVYRITPQDVQPQQIHLSFSGFVLKNLNLHNFS